MKLKLKRRFLLLPTVLVASLLTAACTDNDQTNSNTLNTKSSDQTGSESKSIDKTKDNGEKTSESKNKELNKTPSVESNSISPESELKTSPKSEPEVKNTNQPGMMNSPEGQTGQTQTMQTSDGIEKDKTQGTGHTEDKEMHSDDVSSISSNVSKSIQSEQHGGEMGQTADKPGKQMTGDSAGGGSGGGVKPAAPKSPSPGGSEPQTGTSTQQPEPKVKA